MTDEDWLFTTNPQTMLLWLGYPARSINERKLRLFSVACCRRHWDLLSQRGHSAVEWLERYADGLEDDRAKAAFRQGKGPLSLSRLLKGGRAFFAGAAVTALFSAYHSSPLQNALAVSSWAAGAGRIRTEEQAAQADILRDLFPTIRTPARDAIERRWLEWNDGTVARLAQAIYDERAFERLPILADALEEAGCMTEWVLRHARGAGPHVRGCFLLDALTGRE